MLCGSLVVGTSGFVGVRISGECVFFAPFSIYGGAVAMSADSITYTADVPVPLSISSQVYIPAVFAVPSGGVCLCPCPLSAMDGDTAVTFIGTADSAGGICSFDAVMSDRVFGSVTLNTSVGSYGYAGGCDLEVPFGRTDLSSAAVLSLASGATSLCSDTLSVTADGTDVTAYLVKAELALMQNNALPTVIAVFKPHSGIKAAKLVFTVNGESFLFVVDSVENGSGGLTIGGTMSEPDGELTLYTYGVRASYHAAQNSGRIVWAAADHVAGNISGTFSHFSLACRLAENAGLSVRLLPSGYVLVSGSGADLNVSADHIFSYDTSVTQPAHSLVSVRYGHTDAVVRAEKSKVSGTAYFRVYGYGCEKVSADADSLTLVASAQTETVVEDVYFTEGKATASKPVRRMMTAGMSACGRSLSMLGAAGYVRVSYETSYDRYAVTDNDEGKRSLKLYPMNIAKLYTDSSGSAKTADTGGLCDMVTAMRLARSAAGGKTVTSFVTSHNGWLSAAAGLRFSGAGITGAVSSIKVNIKSNPLIIKDILEVRHD